MPGARRQIGSRRYFVMRVAETNLCKCGFYGDATRECRCTPGQIQQYLGKISGPMLDRIDIHVEQDAARASK